jgi:hypothetical protein
MAPTAFQLNTSFHVNNLVWLCGLSEAEQGPTRRKTFRVMGGYLSRFDVWT